MKIKYLMLLLICIAQFSSAQNSELVRSQSSKTTFSFKGKKKEKGKRKMNASDFLKKDAQYQNNDRGECIKLKLLKPQKDEKYYMKAKKRPVFAWRTNSNRKLQYVFQLYESNANAKSLKGLKKLFEKKTNRTFIKWPSSVKWSMDIKEGSEKEYIWKVSIENNIENVCLGEAIQSIVISNTGFDIDKVSMILECKKPGAYNNNGEVCYSVTEKWVVRNGYSPTSNFLSHSSTTHPGAIMTPVATSSVFTPAPGYSNHSVTYQYDVCLPIGTTFYETELAYTNPMTNRPAKGQLGADSLDNCVCNSCEDWKIKIKKKKQEPWVNPNAGQDYIYLEHDINASSPYGNIVRVDAEIINYDHITQEPCTTCNKTNGQHGTFIPYRVGGNDITNKLSTGFVNGDLSFYNSITGVSSPPPSRNIFWRTPGTGGATMPVTSRLTVGVPNFPDALLRCCSDQIKLCIRYTFTSFSEKYGCRKCSKVVCHKIKRNKNKIVRKTESQTTY